jgi:pheromone shutdown-related protein TraB
MSNNDNQDIRRLTVGEKEIILVGTAHISRDSVETVRRVIESEAPDTVCVELDPQRHQALKDGNRWQSLNLIQVIRKGQGPFLLANLALASFQKRMGLSTGVKPGAELAEAAALGEARGCEVRLVDRDIRTTLLRAWRKTGLWKKTNMVATLVAGMFEKQKLDEKQLADLRQTDTLSAMLDEMGAVLPSVKTILVDERDEYMAYHIRQAPGPKIVAVVGAAHLPGILRLMETDIPAENIAELSSIPQRTTFSRILPWIVPFVVIGLFIIGFYFGDREQLAGAALAWVLANGLLTSLGAAIAFGHPLTIATAFVAAPLTSLNPSIGAGFVTGLVQACIASPTVRDMEQVSEDMATLRGWWTNRMTRVMLVFLFSSVGSALGTIVAFRWLKDLI